MKLYAPVVLIAALAIPVFGPAARGQERPAEAAPAPNEQALANLAEQLAQRAVNLPDVAAKTYEAAARAAQLDSLGALELSQRALTLDRTNLSLLQNPSPYAVKSAARVYMNGGTLGIADTKYDAGTRALDQHKYDEAVKDFDSVIASKSARSDGALYWKAYALNRAGKRDESLAAIAELRKDYASSAWLNDAQVLEAEVKQSAGQPVSPDQETNDDLKLMAINSLMNADSERAIPLIEGVLKGNSAPAVKSRALFVLAQSRSPHAQQVLFDYAKGGDNPDLQLRAIQYLGMSGTKDAQQTLIGIYAGTADARIKNSILQSLLIGHANDALMNIAKTEKDESLRNAAIRDIAANRNLPASSLLDLYATSDTAAKRAIVTGLASRNDGKDLVDLVRKETDASVKMTIVERLGTMHNNKDAMDYMAELLK